MNDRITVVENVYLQTGDGDVEHVVTQYERELFTHEQCYERRLVVNKTWQEIDTGWIKRPGMIVVSNPQGNPPVEVSYKICPFGFLVYGGDSLRVTPSSDEKLRIRCRGFQARVSLVAFAE